MDLGAIFLLLTVVLLTAIFIFRPFWDKTRYQLETKKGSVDLDSDRMDHQISSLTAEKERLLSAIEEMEFDHETGKVTDDLFPEQRAELMQQAAGVLKQLHDLGASGGEKTSSTPKPDKQPYDDLEEMIAKRKVAQGKKGKGFCSKCGNAVKSDDRFCPRCGTPVPGAK